MTKEQIALLEILPMLVEGQDMIEDTTKLILSIILPSWYKDLIPIDWPKEVTELEEYESYYLVIKDGDKFVSYDVYHDTKYCKDINDDYDYSSHIAESILNIRSMSELKTKMYDSLFISLANVPKPDKPAKYNPNFLNNFGLKYDIRRARSNIRIYRRFGQSPR